MEAEERVGRGGEPERWGANKKGVRKEEKEAGMGDRGRTDGRKRRMYAGRKYEMLSYILISVAALIHGLMNMLRSIRTS